MNTYLKPFILAFCLTAFFQVPAFAVGTAGQSTLSQVQMWLTGIGLTIMTIAILSAGYKIAFQGFRISEVSHIFIGGVLIGSAPLIAAMLISG